MRSILLASLVCTCTAAPVFAQQVPTPPIVSPLQPTVVTHGRAIVTARPDRAFVTIAAESRSRTSGEAQKQNATVMTAVLQKIEQAGVPRDAIRTVGYDFQPEFDYANGRRRFGATWRATPWRCGSMTSIVSVWSSMRLRPAGRRRLWASDLTCETVPR